MPRLLAPSISITSTSSPEVMLRQMSHSLQGRSVGPSTQSSALAKIRAVDVLPTPRAPVVRTKEVIPLDTTARGGAKLQDLVNALEQLKVPAEDRIVIVKELYKTGMLHAKLIVE